MAGLVAGAGSGLCDIFNAQGLEASILAAQRKAGGRLSVVQRRREQVAAAAKVGQPLLGNIKAAFEQVREVLEREKVIDPPPKPAGDPPPGGKPPERRSRLRYTHPRDRKE